MFLNCQTQMMMLVIISTKLEFFISTECDNIRSGYLSVVTTVFSQQDGIYGLNSPKGFWRSLPEISLFCQS
jgi:hypothetical protein